MIPAYIPASNLCCSENHLLVFALAQKSVPTTAWARIFGHISFPPDGFKDADYAR
jgi:hypothetical protein